MGFRNDRDDHRSACALKRIIDLLDDLNDEDLRILDAILDRIIKCHSDRNDCD